MKPVTIGLQIKGGEKWYAGVSHLKVFLHAVKQCYGDRFRFMLVGTGIDKVGRSDLREYFDDEILLPVNKRYTVLWLVNGVLSRLFNNDLQIAWFLGKKGVDLIFATSFWYGYGRIPILFWIPDFQHRYLTEMFTEEQRRGRDESFLRRAKSAARIICMSESVKNDVEKFLSPYAEKARVLKTATYIPEHVYKTDPLEITHLYNIPDKFIYLPNQFWKHKNHEIVFKALKILKDKGGKLFVVCSGHTRDDRHRDYFVELLRKVSLEGIRDQVAFVGLLPREHVFQFMRQSICILNPSLFEGFGMTIDEAWSLGKEVLASDIPAHREQNPPMATFFNPRDVEDLAGKIDKIWQQTKPGPDIELEEGARKSLPERIAECAKSFVSIVEEVLG